MKDVIVISLAPYLKVTDILKAIEPSAFDIVNVMSSYYQLHTVNVESHLILIFVILWRPKGANKKIF